MQLEASHSEVAGAANLFADVGAADIDRAESVESVGVFAQFLGQPLVGVDAFFFGLMGKGREANRL